MSRLWSDLTHALSGMLGASLHQMASPPGGGAAGTTIVTSVGSGGRQEEGGGGEGAGEEAEEGPEAVGEAAARRDHAGNCRYRASLGSCSAPSSTAAPSAFEIRSWLPKEPFCAENLAPWLKLLPCKDRSGSLVRGQRDMY